jgi:hypothetical protein
MHADHGAPPLRRHLAEPQPPLTRSISALFPVAAIVARAGAVVKHQASQVCAQEMSE